MGGGGLGNRLLVNGGRLGGDFVNASMVVPGSFGSSGFVVDSSTSGCFRPKSTKVMAFTVVCLVVSASMLVLGVVARMVGLLMKPGGLLIKVFSSFSSLSTRNLGWRGSPNKNGLCMGAFIKTQALFLLNRFPKSFKALKAEFQLCFSKASISVGSSMAGRLFLEDWP